MSEELVPRRIICMVCWVNCGLIAYVDPKTQRVAKVEGDPNNPQSSGRICEKGKRLIELHEHPSRLNYPLKRVGERGQGEWKRITWDQALDEIAAKLLELREKYGSETLFATGGTGRHCDDFPNKSKFLHLWGSLNRYQFGPDCWCNNYVIDTAIAGGPMMVSYLTPTSPTRLMMIMGQNTYHSQPVTYPAYKKLGAEMGAKIIVVDPCFTDTVRGLADVWLPIRPATDTALLLFWINSVISENSYDKEFVEEWTNAPFLVRTDTRRLLRGNDLDASGSRENFVAMDTVTGKPAIWISADRGFNLAGAKPALEGSFNVKLADGSTVEAKTVWTLLKERVAEYTLDRVSNLTWISKDKLIETANMVKSLKPLVIPWGVATDQVGFNSAKFVMAKNILRAITGSINKEGGHLIYGPHPDVVTEGEAVYYEQVSERTKQRQPGSDRFKLMAWPGWEMLTDITSKYWYGKKILTPERTNQCNGPALWLQILSGKPYPIRAGISTASNPMTHGPDIKCIFKALMSLDLYVVKDFFMAPHAMLADYVLPTSDFLERPLIHMEPLHGTMNMCVVGVAAVKPTYERWSDFKFWRELGLRVGQPKEAWSAETEEEDVEWRIRKVMDKHDVKTLEEY
ncbi:MAG: molybdopterin-dependent oxidoreductase, partial [Candidatus Bathyarchaeia archaeon]